MISFDFDYYQAESAEEAVAKFLELKKDNKEVLYYNGGTEIVTYARKDKITFDALIDLKNIPKAAEFEVENGEIIFGASLCLNEIIEADIFPLLSESLKGVAEHTTRNQITLGGNITGKLPYKEAILPFLAADAEIISRNKDGLNRYPITEVFDKRMLLDEEEILLKIIVEERKTDLAYFQTRKVKQSEADYPILHMAALKDDNKIKMALSSLCAFAFRDQNIEEIINDHSLTLDNKIEQVIENLPVPISSNQRAGREYKEMLLKKSLKNCLECLGGE